MKRFELNYISSWFMKVFAFYLFDYPWIKEWFCMIVLLSIVYDKKCEDMMFCDLEFLMKYSTLVSSTMSTRIIVDTIRPFSTGIIVNLYIPW